MAIERLDGFAAEPDAGVNGELVNVRYSSARKRQHLAVVPDTTPYGSEEAPETLNNPYLTDELITRIADARAGLSEMRQTKALGHDDFMQRTREGLDAVRTTLVGIALTNTVQASEAALQATEATAEPWIGSSIVDAARPGVPLSTVFSFNAVDMDAEEIDEIAALPVEAPSHPVLLTTQELVTAEQVGNSRAFHPGEDPAAWRLRLVNERLATENARQEHQQVRQAAFEAAVAAEEEYIPIFDRPNKGAFKNAVANWVTNRREKRDMFREELAWIKADMARQYVSDSADNRITVQNVAEQTDQQERAVADAEIVSSETFIDKTKRAGGYTLAAAATLVAGVVGVRYMSSPEAPDIMATLNSTTGQLRGAINGLFAAGRETEELRELTHSTELDLSHLRSNS